MTTLSAVLRFRAGIWILSGALVLANAASAQPAPAPHTPTRGEPPVATDLRTPPPGPAPHLNGPTVYGARPGASRPFLYRIPCTGERPIRFAAEGLPESLSLDPETGIISGATPELPGVWPVTLRATNAFGSDERLFRITVGERLALTPPMGWNSWYIHYQRVSQQVMEEAAAVMIASGMADFGYQYVNIDDCWMKQRDDPPYRDANGDLLTNDRFPDIKAMVEAIHARGLKAGTYISPGPWTCAGYTGSWGHEAQDAAKFAEWGFDFLKYDWCSYGDKASGEGFERFARPYVQMGRLLELQDRDIVLNHCQYGMANVWEWGSYVGGHSWRTTGDLGLERDTHLPGFYQIGLSNAQHWPYARPGGWNDPDYILIGWVGSAFEQGEGTKTTLSPGEQYSYMSMWSLMAAPLFFSGDMAKLDSLTLNVLCNHEVIDVNQDALGKQARIVRQDSTSLVLAKPMEDGSLAVGFFNLSENPMPIRAGWTELGRLGPQRVRDLWWQRDEAVVDEALEVVVPRHDVKLVRLWAESR